MKISMIAAVVNSNLAIGKGNELLWDLPSDLKYFKKITKGHVVLMGAKTYLSIGRPLPDRINVVLDNQGMVEEDERIHIIKSIEEALNFVKSLQKSEIFVIGGASIYRQMLGMANKLYLTLVEGHFEGDAFFPEWRDEFEIVKGCPLQEENGIKFRFTEWERRHF